jgi:hypothetical protein
MNWTKESGPNEEISYNHIKLSTPLGEFVIDWKGWKEYPSYSIELEDTYSECEHTCKTSQTNSMLLWSNVKKIQKSYHRLKVCKENESKRIQKAKAT